MTNAIAPTAATPMPTYCHVSRLMTRNVIGSDASRYPLKGPY